MAKQGKRLKKAYEGLDPDAPPVKVEEAVKRIKERATAKFDETVEVAMNLNIDPRKQDQNLRGVRTAFGDKVMALVPEMERDVTGLPAIEKLAAGMFA